jgi:inosine-uridine nucleoside N-ribohydrolase
MNFKLRYNIFVAFFIILKVQVCTRFRFSQIVLYVLHDNSIREESMPMLRRTLPVLFAARTTTNMRPQHHQRLIIDTDVGIDDLVAIRSLAAAAHKDLDPNNLVITTVKGMSEIHIGASYLRTISPQFSVLEGASHPSDASNEKIPEWLRNHRRDMQRIITDHFGNDDFAMMDSTSTKNSNSPADDVEALYSFLRSSPDRGVTVLCLGPLTNVAQWLDEEGPLLEQKVSNIWILGGNDPTTATPDSRPEFNFSQDAAATKQVLMSRNILAPKIHLVLGSATSPDEHPHVVKEVTDFVQDRTGTGGLFYSDLLKQYPREVCFDPICAYLMEHPQEAAWEEERVTVNEKTGLLQRCNDEEGVRISLTRKITLDDSYWTWIRKAIGTDDDSALAPNPDDVKH